MFTKLGFAKELQGGCEFNEKLTINTIIKNKIKINYFKTKSLSRKVSSLGGHICNASGQQLNYIHQISNKNLKWIAPWMLFLMLKYHLKSLFFQARPVNVHAES